MPSPTHAPTHTLVLLLDEERVLLARKKRGFGAGYLVGVGGRIERGESAREGAVRETREEIGVTLLAAERVATLHFAFPHRPAWDLRAAVFVSRRWRGDPAESDEVAPGWFPRAAVPYASMWDDARLWLPAVLGGRRVRARFVFADDARVGRYALEEVGRGAAEAALDEVVRAAAGDAGSTRPPPSP